MAKINLLPWREELRKIKQRQFNIMLGFSALAGILFSALIFMYYSGQVSGQIKRNELLRVEITAVELKIKEIEELDKRKLDLLNRKKVIEELQGKRYEMVKLFTALAKTIADGAQITGLNQTGSDLTITGRAQSSARVSTYMKNIMSSNVISQPDLTVIEARGGDRSLPYEFILNAKLTPIAKTAEEGATDIETTPEVQ
ncbi:MAG: PilN domain-containing protein [Arenimonas sp.]|nr:PilN domain-containing protein [Arenimonas sp.]MBP6309131.1 PilN domain-containing protein [Arenimonas sp.]